MPQSLSELHIHLSFRTKRISPLQGYELDRATLTQAIGLGCDRSPLWGLRQTQMRAQTVALPEAAGLKPRPSRAPLYDGDFHHQVLVRPQQLALLLQRAQRPRVRLRLVAGLALLCLCAPRLSRGQEVNLARRYRSGQKMVYATKMHTKAVVHSDPPELQSFLPPLPTDFSSQQQNTVTVKEVHSDGSADIENHFDKFQFQSDLAAHTPAGSGDSAESEQREISQHVAGQDIVAHYDRDGKLLGFEGGEGLFEDLDVAYREPLRQALRFFLEQVGGGTLYPGSPVTPGITWKRQLNSPASAAYPYDVTGENTLRYVGKTKVGDIEAAIVEFSFVNMVRPSSKALGPNEPLSQLASHGMGVDMHIDGQGQGKVLLALDDGRVLENHATIHQTLSARLENSDSIPFTDKKTLKLVVQSDSEMDVVGTGK